MRQLFILFFLLAGWCFKANSAEVIVSLSGLNEGDTAQLVVSSDTFLSTIKATSDGTFTFENVPVGTHYVKAESAGYECSPTQTVIVKEDGTVSPSQNIKLALTPIAASDDEWHFLWKEDGSTAGYTQTSRVNKSVDIEYLGKKIVPADVPSYSILEKDYHIVLEDAELPWSQEYAYRLVETMKMFPISHTARPYAIFKLTDQHLVDDISVSNLNGGYEVTLSKDVFVYANPFLVNLDGVRGRLFSKRLHHAMTNFLTDFGQDGKTADTILSKRFGCRILNVDYKNLTKGITDEDENHFQAFFPTEIVSMINMLEELPEGFHVTDHLNYLIRRINGMPHPLYPTAAAVSWCVDNGYIEFMESAFGGNNQDFETLRLILHEKTHFLWQYVFSDEIKNDWIKVGGWYEDPNASEGWSTTKDVEFVSAYAHAKNPNEDMAESVAFYLKNPDMLMSRSPEKYEFICNRIMHGTRYISKIPDHLTFEVLNLNPDYAYPGKIKRLNVTSKGAPDEDKTVTVEIELNDAEGFDDEASEAYVRLYSPQFILEGGTLGSQLKDVRMYPVNKNGHLLRGSATISRYSKSGHWTAGDITVTDTQGNQRFEGRNDCVFDLFVNNTLEDTEAPKYEGDLRYILTDSIADNHQLQNLQVRFKVSDNIGFSRIACRLQMPGSTYIKDYDGVYDETTGEGIIDIPITEYFRQGDYYIRQLFIEDKAGNKTWPLFSDAAKDYPVQYVTISTSDPDTTNPEIDLNRITVYAEPTHPEAPDGETLVTISFYGRDDKSGFGKCNYRLRDPQGIDHFEYFYHRNYRTLYFDGDPTVWERYVIKVVLPKGSAPGIWGLSQMTIADKAFNELTYNFVETLIFEPDNDTSGYVLFADIDDDLLSFGFDAPDVVNYRWRIIHEELGYELNGMESLANACPMARVMAKSANKQVDISGMPEGDLILITEILDESGKPVSVKTKRLTYSKTVITPIYVESITLEPTEWDGVIGKAFPIIAKILPEDATDPKLEWSSSDEEVASVDNEGMVVIHKKGSSLITARATDGSGVSATYLLENVSTSVDKLFYDSTEKIYVYDVAGGLIGEGNGKEIIETLSHGVYIIRKGQTSVRIMIE